MPEDNPCNSTTVPSGAYPCPMGCPMTLVNLHSEDSRKRTWMTSLANAGLGNTKGIALTLGSSTWVGAVWS